MHYRDPLKERYWRVVIQRQGRSGRTARQFCLDEGLDESSFYHWRRELQTRDLERSQGIEQRPRQEAKSIARHHNKSQAIERSSARASDTPVFVPIRVAEDRLPCLEVVLECGATLRIPAGFDRDTLLNVVEVLERPRC